MKNRKKNALNANSTSRRDFLKQSGMMVGTGLLLSNPTRFLAGDSDSASFDTINDLLKYKIAQPPQIKTVIINGFYSAGDGGGGSFYWASSERKSNHNGGTIINPDHNAPSNSGIGSPAWYSSTGDGTVDTGTGCWKRESIGYINVKWFGAKGNNSNDDINAIQATINYLNEGEVFFPQGKYRISSAIDVDGKQIDLVGESASYWDKGNNESGSVIWATDTSKSDCIYIHDSSNAGNSVKIIRNLYIRGNDDTTSSNRYGIYLYGVRDVRILNCKISRNASSGIVAESSDRVITNENYLQDCLITGNGSNGVRWYSADSWVENNRIGYSSGDGLVIGAPNNRIKNNRCDLNSGHGINSASSGTNISDNICDHNDKTGIYSYGDSTIICNNHCFDNGVDIASATQERCGIFISQSGGTNINSVNVARNVCDDDRTEFTITSIATTNNVFIVSGDASNEIDPNKKYKSHVYVQGHPTQNGFHNVTAVSYDTKTDRTSITVQTDLTNSASSGSLSARTQYNGIEVRNDVHGIVDDNTFNRNIVHGMQDSHSTFSHQTTYKEKRKISFGTVTANSVSEYTFIVKGARQLDVVSTGFSGLPLGVGLTACVSSKDTVTIRLNNSTSGSVSVGSKNIVVVVMRRNDIS